MTRRAAAWWARSSTSAPTNRSWTPTEKLTRDKLQPIIFDPIHNAYRKLGEKAGNAFRDGAKLK